MKKLKPLPAKYKKLIPAYSLKMSWSEVDQVFVVSVEELPGCMTHGKDALEAVKRGYEAIETHLMGMVEDGEEPPTPYSQIKFKGEFLVRGTPELHSKLHQAMRESGHRVFNKFVVDVLKKSVG